MPNRAGPAGVHELSKAAICERLARVAEITKGRAWQLSPCGFLALAWWRIKPPDSRYPPLERCEANAHSFVFLPKPGGVRLFSVAFNYTANISALVPRYVGRRSRMRVTPVTCEPRHERHVDRRIAFPVA